MNFISEGYALAVVDFRVTIATELVLFTTSPIRECSKKASKMRVTIHRTGSDAVVDFRKSGVSLVGYVPQLLFRSFLNLGLPIHRRLAKAGLSSHKTPTIKML